MLPYTTPFACTPEVLSRFAPVLRTAALPCCESMGVGVAERRGFFGERIFGGSKRHVRAHRPLSCPAAASPTSRPPCG